MAKKNAQKQKDNTMSMISLVLTFIGLGVGAAASFLPYWYTVTPQMTLGWNMRYIGLIKLSGMFTDVMVTPADLLWNTVKAGVCEMATGYGMIAGGASAKGVGGAMAMNLILGITCTKACQENLFARCFGYNTFMYIGYVTAGLIVLGGLIALVGSVMPYLGKEKAKDKWSNLYVILLGAIIYIAGPTVYVVFSSSMYAKIRRSSYYPPMALGPSFFMTIGGSACLLIATYCQYSKAKAASAPKAAAEDPAGIDPTLIDPTLL